MDSCSSPNIIFRPSVRHSRQISLRQFQAEHSSIPRDFSPLTTVKLLPTFELVSHLQTLQLHRIGILGLPSSTISHYHQPQASINMAATKVIQNPGSLDSMFLAIVKVKQLTVSSEEWEQIAKEMGGELSGSAVM